MYLPEDPEKECLPAANNPMRVVCSCKGSRHHGICSHVLAVNAACGHFNIWAALQKTDPRTRPWKRPKHARGRSQVQPDSGEDDFTSDSSGSEQDMEDL